MLDVLECVRGAVGRKFWGNFLCRSRIFRGGAEKTFQKRFESYLSQRDPTAASHTLTHLTQLNVSTRVSGYTRIYRTSFMRDTSAASHVIARFSAQTSFSLNDRDSSLLLHILFTKCQTMTVVENTLRAGAELLETRAVYGS